jgi:ketosteroid isomerase-like protein
VDKDKLERDKRAVRQTAVPSDSHPQSNIEEFFRGLQPEIRHAKPGREAVAAAIESAQRLAAEVDAEHSADRTAEHAAHSVAGEIVVCRACGHRNRTGNHFCGSCGTTLDAAGHAPSQALAVSPNPEHERHAAPGGVETHHYHHHYHHHFFPAGYDGGGMPRGSEPVREDRVRPGNVALRGDMSRAEAAVRTATQEWVLACNTKHLDDLLDLYVPDALVLRANYAPVRGAASVREFFFGILNAGLGEVEVEPLRLEVVGDLAYEAGRCKALVPSAAGKRREERGKYLWVFARQSNGEWKLAVDCWSSDLTLTMLESDVPQGTTVRTNPRKTP